MKRHCLCFAVAMFLLGGMLHAENCILVQDGKAMQRFGPDANGWNFLYGVYYDAEGKLREDLTTITSDGTLLYYCRRIGEKVDYAALESDEIDCEIIFSPDLSAEGLAVLEIAEKNFSEQKAVLSADPEALVEKLKEKSGE